MLRDALLLCETTHLLQERSGGTKLPTKPPMVPGCLHIPKGTGRAHLLNPTAAKGKSRLCAHSMSDPGEKKGATQPRTTGGGGLIQEQGPWKGSASPETTLLDFTSTSKGFLLLSWVMAITVLIVG